MVHSFPDPQRAGFAAAGRRPRKSGADLYGRIDDPFTQSAICIPTGDSGH